MTDVSKSPDRIAGMFDAIAGRYDFLNHLLSAGIDRRWRRCAIQSLSLSGSERVLDLCTGTGDLAIAAIEAQPGAKRVVGVDFAEAMLGVAMQKIRRQRLDKRVDLLRGDATRIPVATRSVDVVTVAFGIRNVENVALACDEIFRTLVPGGRLAILEFAIPSIPVVRSIYLWYFKRVLPTLGRLVSKHQGAYGYLPASVHAFAPPDEFVTILRHHGFADVHARRLTLGVVFLYTARRPY